MPFWSQQILNASRAFLRKAKTANASTGVWRTTEDGNKIFISGAGEVRAGGPNGPVLKPAAGSDKLTESGAKKKKKRSAAEPRVKIDDAIRDFLQSDNKEYQKQFRWFVDEAHKFLGEKRNGDRYSLQQVLGAFGIKGQASAAWIGALRFKSDYSTIRGFDQMAEYAARYHPELLSIDTGESSSGKDLEQAFFNRLQEGFPYAPAKTSEEVLRLAEQMAGPSFFSGWDEGGSGDSDYPSDWDDVDDDVPF